MAQRGYRTIRLATNKGDVAIYTSARVADALQTIAGNATLYEGVRLTQVLEAAYEQGKKDGARDAFEHLDKSVAAAKKSVPHKRPGRPRKRR